MDQNVTVLVALSVLFLVGNGVAQDTTYVVPQRPFPVVALWDVTTTEIRESSTTSGSIPGMLWRMIR
jgi:hypothetical protein